MLAGTISVRGRESKDEQETARANPSGDYVDWCSQEVLDNVLASLAPLQGMLLFFGVGRNFQTIYSIDIIIGDE